MQSLLLWMFKGCPQPQHSSNSRNTFILNEFKGSSISFSKFKGFQVFQRGVQTLICHGSEECLFFFSFSFPLTQQVWVCWVPLLLHHNLLLQCTNGTKTEQDTVLLSNCTDTQCNGNEKLYSVTMCSCKNCTLNCECRMPFASLYTNAHRPCNHVQFTFVSIYTFIKGPLTRPHCKLGYTLEVVQRHLGSILNGIIF